MAWLLDLSVNLTEQSHTQTRENAAETALSSHSREEGKVVGESKSQESPTYPLPLELMTNTG